ncbi:hypothetical protein [Actinoplanes flavus]|uniref:Uncharacterized protein n=1 Tax=Actinoplanes flavus TaxID=2820290 RepID=A0ABS3UL32_9ACTN|nr:hypothetical protein [Actinoplanes flavus]MBO3739500.1 hypothetical protein [Actinoplanes flavus]
MLLFAASFGPVLRGLFLDAFAGVPGRGRDPRCGYLGAAATVEIAAALVIGQETYVARILTKLGPARPGAGLAW